MARRQEAASLLKQGLSPREIAAEMKVTLETVIQYLYHQIGEGKIRRSDVVFSIDPRTRRHVESIIAELQTENPMKIVSAVKKSDSSIKTDDLYAYLQFRDARLALGDMYEIIRDIELTLHDAMRRMLYVELGESWWRNGVPEQIRVECQTGLEKDPEPAEEPYCYTTFIHLREILDKRWEVFSKTLSKKVSSNKKALLEGLARLNQIRNSVMHPVRGTRLTEEDFAFVRRFQEDIELERWREYAAGRLLEEIMNFEERDDRDG
jgi:predicted transcriptional regulator